MPVQIRNEVPVRRRLGQEMPDVPAGGLVELRLHGVGGTPPGDILGDVAPQLVSGDRIAGFYRTADQPTPADSDGPAVRHVEAYSWGGLTSRSATRVLWVLMLPFALANAVGWMCTKAVFDRAPLFYLHRFAVRFAGLVMTINVVVLLLMTGEDLIAVKCAGTPTCQKAFAPAELLDNYWFADHTGRAMAVGALLPVVVLLLFFVLSRVSTHRYERVPAPSRSDSDDVPKTSPTDEGFEDTAARPGLGLSDGRFWNGYGAARRLAGVHLAAGLAVTAGTLAWTTHHTLTANPADTWNAVIFAVAAILLGATIFTLLSDRVMHGVTWPFVGGAGLALIGAVVNAWVIPADASSHTIVSGMRWALDGVYALMVIAIVLTLVGCVWAWKPGSFLVCGPACVLVVAFTFVNAIGALVILWLGQWIKSPAFAPSYRAGHHDEYFYTFVQSASVWCVTSALAVTVVFGLSMLFVWWLRGRRDYRKIMKYPPEEGGYDPGPGDDSGWTTRPNEPYSKADKRWLREIARARFFATVPIRFDLLVTLVAVAVTATLAVVIYLYLKTDDSIEPVSPLATAASAAAAAAPVALLAIMRWGWRSDTARRQIGITWDVITFWPRAYHPFAPPCYAERAVPELQWRLWYLQHHGAKIAIAAHSQGSVVATAALAQQPHRMPGSNLGLLTFGCPLDTLYRWAFPAYFTNELFSGIVTPATDADRPAGVGRWVNRYCMTDYIGNTPVAGSETEVIPDPPEPDYIRGRPRPTLGAHTGYWTHPRVWHDIESLHLVGDPAPVTVPSQDRPGVAGVKQ